MSNDDYIDLAIAANCIVSESFVSENEVKKAQELIQRAVQNCPESKENQWIFDLEKKINELCSGQKNNNSRL